MVTSDKWQKFTLKMEINVKTFAFKKHWRTEKFLFKY